MVLPTDVVLLKKKKLSPRRFCFHGEDTQFLCDVSGLLCSVHAHAVTTSLISDLDLAVVLNGQRGDFLDTKLDMAGIAFLTC